MAEDTREIAVTVRVQRKTWYMFGNFCRANQVPIYRGVEMALRVALEQSGALTGDESPYSPVWNNHSEASVKVDK
jgi:shikimate 5-dehydrogenase